MFTLDPERGLLERKPPQDRTLQASVVLAHHGPEALRRFWENYAPYRIDPHDGEPGSCPECSCPDCDNPLGAAHTSECSIPTLAGC